MGARIAIRVDGSHKVGMGHVFRMANLAEALHAAGVGPISFGSVTDTQVGAWLRERNFNVVPLAGKGRLAEIAAWLHACKADVVVNDVLDTDFDYMALVKECGCRVVNFDDNGPGRRLADYCINALPSKMLPDNVDSSVLQGPDYLLLGEEFTITAPIRAVVDQVDRLLVTLGGSDTHGNTMAVVAALKRIDYLHRVDIITGPAFRHQAELSRLVNGVRGYIIHASVPSIAQFMQGHELAVVGGGISLFEAAVCALPTLSVASEDFEGVNIRWAQAKGITRMAGEGQPAEADHIFTAVSNLLKDRQSRHSMSEAGPKIVDGLGRTRIVNTIEKLCN